MITGLGLGGAEAMLAKLVGASGGYRHLVISLGDQGPLAPAIEAAGAPVYALRLNRHHRLITALPRLAYLLRKEQPDLIQGWLNHGNLAAMVARGLSGADLPVVWNVRQTLLGLKLEKPLTRRIVLLNARLSRRTSAIVYNSLAGAHEHEAIGFDPSKRHFIPNGFDLERFSPSPAARAAARANLGIGEEELVVGLIARFDPWKNHRAFFEAASKVLDVEPRVRFLFAGEGMVPSNPVLAAQIRDPRVIERSLLLGPRGDIPDITRTLDIACNVSHGEGFPNAIGEAMATGVPCIVTDVSDMRAIVGDTGIVCESSEPGAVAEAILRLVHAGADMRSGLGRTARSRIEAEFSLPMIVSRYETLYGQLLRSEPQPHHI